MKRIAFVLALIPLLMVVEQGYAQTDDGPYQRPELWTRVQDTIWMFLPQGNGDTLDPNLVSGSYEFTMQHDSTCLTSYFFTEPWHNGRLLKLLHWEFKRQVNHHEDYLSLNSRTEDFTLRAGDTVSFVRDFRWFNAKTMRQTLNNFCSRDTLTYAVELVGTEDSARYQKRLALIDSFGVLPRLTPGEPRFIGSGNRAVMAKRQYVIPTSLNGRRVFMRVRVRARGAGEYFFTREDFISSNYSGLLRNPDIITGYINYLNHDQFWKPVSTENDAMQGMAAIAMDIERDIADDARIAIKLATAPLLGRISVAIYDVQGNQLATPFTGILDEPRTVSYTFPSSGTYLIGITSGNQILHTEKILITR